MVTLIQAVVIAALCSGAPPQEGWGILSFRQGKPVLFSTTHLPKDMRLRAHRVGAWKTHADVVVGDGHRDENSALFDQDGSPANWVHATEPRAPLARDALWVCLPEDLTVVGSDSKHAVLKRGAKRVGSLEVATQSEGVTFTLRLGDRSEQVYYYLGYDVK